MKLTTISILAVIITLWNTDNLRATTIPRSTESTTTLIPGTVTRPDDYEERYAALECQNEQIFAVVNFYKHGLFRLSWGIDDQVIEADRPVTRHSWGVHETFTGHGITLNLPESTPDNDYIPRLGDLRVSRPRVQLWRGLRCLLHGAD
jgi:hypothetical protein